MWTIASMRGLGATLFALALGLTLGCADSGRPGLTYANYEKIKKDGSMTEEDVNKLLDSKGVLETEFLGNEVAGALGKAGQPLAKMVKGLGEMGSQATGIRRVFWGTKNRHVKCIIVNGKVNDVMQQGL